MRTAFLLFFGLLLSIFASSAHANLPAFTPVEDIFVRAVPLHDTLKKGEKSALGIEFNLPNGWHIYWKNPGDSGLPPTVKVESDVIEVGVLRYPAPTRFVAFDIVGYGYKESALLQLPITLIQKSDTPITATVQADFLMCKDICIPGTFRTELTWQTGENSVLNQSAEPLFTQFSLPTPYTFDLTINYTGEGYLLSSDSDTITGFIPDQNGMVDDTVLPQTQGNALFIPEDTWRGPVNKLSGLIQINNGTWHTLQLIQVHEAASAIQKTPPAASNLFLWLLLSAFIAGIILNLMPCVLPILALKVLAFTKGEGNDHAGSYTLGILTGFWAVAGTILALKWAGTSVGWGFHLQNPVFVAGLTLLMVLVGLNLLSVFYIPTPRFIGMQRYDAGKNGAFFTGLLAVVVATPCTAPFMSGAVAYALTQGASSSFAIFTVMGLGLALPYVALAHMPFARRILPQPGAWMETLKNTLAFPMFATALWLAWVFTNLTDAQAAFILLAMILFVSLLVWLYGRAQSHQKKSTPLWLFAICMALIISVFALTQKPKDTSWGIWSDQNLENALLKNNPVFVNVTADWCVTCKFTEATLLNRDKTQALFNEHNVTYLKADWTNSDVKITALLERFNRKGVPLYLLYFPNGDVKTLSQLPTYSEIKKVLTE